MATLRHLVWFLGLSGLVLVGQPVIVQAQSGRVAFYVVAHQDDWQLFMNAFKDVTTPPSKIVFVYTTAGGACGPDGNNPEGHPIPFYLARELGAQAGARALAAANQADQALASMDNVLLTGDLNHQHSVRRYIFRNTVSYFLRLPESGNNPFCCDGSDTEINNPCLLTLQSGSTKFPTLTAVDGSATYQSWKDLVLTLTSLVRKEADQAQNSDLSFNIQDPDKDANQFDNPDHYATGTAMLQVTHDFFPGASVTLYCEYSTALNPANVSCLPDVPPGESNCNILQNKSAVFATSSLALADSSWPSSWDPQRNPTHTSWLSRLYSRPPSGPQNYCLAPHVLPFAALHIDIVPLIHGFAP